MARYQWQDESLERLEEGLTSLGGSVIMDLSLERRLKDREKVIFWTCNLPQVG